MNSKLAVSHLGIRSILVSSGIVPFPCADFCSSLNVSFRTRNSNSKFKFKLVCQSHGDKWKLNDIDTSAVQERLASWMSKTQTFVNGVTSSFVKNSSGGITPPRDPVDNEDLEDMFMVEQTLQSRTPYGTLSLAAIISIEQFSRMNGSTGQKMQNIFKALVAESVYSDARNLVEYCCFRFLSRDSSDVHPGLKETAFQRLIFITMLAWENPYHNENDTDNKTAKKLSIKKKLVKEEAFVRIAPAVSGLADWTTAHHLFRALAGEKGGISLRLWHIYIEELLKVHEGRKPNQIRESIHLPGENVVCIGSGRKRPVLRWKNNMAWPGKVTLTDRALYFEAIVLKGETEVIRLDLTGPDSRVEKTKVGPLGYALFDSAVSVLSGDKSEAWVLEFVDLGGEMRRDVWHAFISEIIALYDFIREYGPEDADETVSYVYGAHKGKQRATTSAINSITRLQALQFIRKLLDDPIKLVQFSHLQSAVFGDVVSQTLAVNYWGGQLVTKFTDARDQLPQYSRPSDETADFSNHVFDLDGSVFLRRWMRSPSWASNPSIAFWKSPSVRKGLVLGKNLVVADRTLVEKSAIICKQKCQVVEKTQATIDAAMIKGIPSNIDLFKELLFPLSIAATNFQKLRRWEEPHLTISFLALAYTIVFRNLLSYIFPAALITLAATMLLLKGLKEQGRLGRSFGKVTIQDQPPSNTIQQIIAVKEAMLVVENYLQKLNVTLLKVRTIILSGQPQVTTEVALVLLSSATILLVIPFKYVVSFVLFDLFTRELEFRREMTRRFLALLKERWDTVPAAPVVVQPYKSEKTKLDMAKQDPKEKGKPKRIQSNSSNGKIVNM